MQFGLSSWHQHSKYLTFHLNNIVMKQLFDPFVLPFVVGMVFVLTYCVIAAIRVFIQLPKGDRKRLLKSFFSRTLFKDIKDLFCDCLLHVKIWRRNKILGLMHSAIAFGWFMIIVIGHIQVFVLLPKVSSGEMTYLPIFYRYFVPQTAVTPIAQIFAFLMDFFLLLIILGIFIAVVKKLRSQVVGVKRTTKFGFIDMLIRYALWTIFPFRLLAETTQIKVFWWLYSIDLCLFMFLLPFTRYMHIPAEMLLIVMRNAGLSARSARRGYSLVELYSCPGCGLCIDACPMNTPKTNGSTSTAYFIRNLRKNNTTTAKNIAETCLMCGKCVEVCPVGIQSVDIKTHVRQSIEKSFADLSYLNEIKEEKIEPKQQKIVYFAGCMTHLTPKILASMRTILAMSGQPFEILDSTGGICCGRPMLLTGKVDDARAMIEKNTALINAQGATTLVLSCPICYKVFKKEYDLQGIEILHHTELIDRMMKDKKVHFSPSSQHFVYHDPCDMRNFGLFDAPRRILSACGTLVEANENKDLSICCGGGLGSLTLSKEERDAITLSSLENLQKNKPDVIVTSCPLCLKTFSRLSSVDVRDISEIVVRQKD